MPSPIPKDPKLVQHRIKHSTRATLEVAAAKRRKPSLPKDRDWHKMVKEWWNVVWKSPMCEEFLDADIPRLYIVADLYEDYWSGELSNARKVAVAAEIRLQSQCFGLTPIDRRRLQWEVKKVEGDTRRSPRPKAKNEKDPRTLVEVA